MTTFNFRGYDVPVDLALKTGSRIDNFEQIAAWHVSQIEKNVGIKPTDNVVEIGCGIGRIAIPLTTLLGQGTYLGTEVIRPSVEWLTQNVASRNTNFRFIHHDIHDTLHNPAGTLSALDITLPVGDATVDLIMLHSVFTHMFGHEISHYLREFRRILKPGGHVYASCFLVTPEALESVQSGRGSGNFRVRFEHDYGGGSYVDALKELRAAVAFEDAVFQQMIVQSGLSLKDTLWGTWSGARANPRSGQDVVILQKSE